MFLHRSRKRGSKSLHCLLRLQSVRRLLLTLAAVALIIVNFHHFNFATRRHKDCSVQWRTAAEGWAASATLRTSLTSGSEGGGDGFSGGGLDGGAADGGGGGLDGGAADGGGGGLDGGAADGGGGGHDGGVADGGDGGGSGSRGRMRIALVSMSTGRGSGSMGAVAAATRRQQATQAGVDVWVPVALNSRSAEFAGLLDVTGPNKRLYAQLHGYTYIDASGLMDYARPASWSKIPAVLSVLDEYDWIFWMDADTLITNLTTPLEVLLPLRSRGAATSSASVEGGRVGMKQGSASPSIPWSPDILLTADSTGVNAGVWLIRGRGCVWCRSFLERWWGMEVFIRRGPGDTKSGDNDALKHMITNMDSSELSSHVGMAPQCAFNSYLWRRSIRNIVRYVLHPRRVLTGLWQTGDFVMHAAGVANKMAVLTAFSQRLGTEYEQAVQKMGLLGLQQQRETAGGTALYSVFPGSAFPAREGASGGGGDGIAAEGGSVAVARGGGEALEERAVTEADATQTPDAGGSMGRELLRFGSTLVGRGDRNPPQQQREGAGSGEGKRPQRGIDGRGRVAAGGPHRGSLAGRSGRSSRGGGAPGVDEGDGAVGGGRGRIARQEEEAETEVRLPRRMNRRYASGSGPN